MSSVTPASLPLPPYGHMNNDFNLEMALAPVPEQFRVGGKLATVAEYDTYIETEVTRMADILWPRWDFAARAWVGGAAATAMELTLSDLALMRELRTELAKEVVVGTRKLGKSQQGLFRLEDRSARGTIDLYLAPLQETAPTLLDAMKASVDDGFKRLGATTLRFKQHFQRPRAYQAAHALGQDFDYEYGATAVTPALVSGHCMQGLFVRTYATMINRVKLAEHLGAIEAMRQYAREIGDRRVFAGVHYPSDSLSSWYTSLRMCEHSFTGFAQEARDFMWQAITGSVVFQAMTRAAHGAHPVYAPLLKWLEAEAARKVT